MEENEPAGKSSSKLALICFLLTLTALFTAIMSGFGNGRGVWDFRVGFTMLRYSIYAFAAIFLVCTVLVLRAKSGATKKDFQRIFIALVISFGMVNYVLNWIGVARSVPGIHDITTDLDNPPAFVDVVALRAADDNTHVHGGAELAAKQREGYPDLGPLMLDGTVAQAIERAEATALDMGWDIVASVPAEGRLEATDTTFWYGFKDDIVVRVSAAEKGSRVDVRSVSRVGGSDIGTNARRITRFLKRLEGAE